MTHDEVVGEIQRRASARGILSHYCGRAVACRGDRGQPDLVLVGAQHTGFVEVKMPSDTRDPGQTTWYHKLRGTGALVEQMGPRDLDSGVVDLFLTFLNEG